VIDIFETTPTQTAELITPKKSFPISWILLFAVVAAFGIYLYRNAAPIDSSPGVKGMQVLFVEERDDITRTPPEQLAAYNSIKVRKWLDENKAAYHTCDQDDDISSYGDSWTKMKAKPRKSLPWVYIQNGRRSVSQEMPKDVNSMLKLLEANK